MKFSELGSIDEAISPEERKLKQEMAKLGLAANMYEVNNGRITGLMGFNVKYKPEMANDENFVKDGKLVHNWDMVGAHFIVRHLGLTTLTGCPEHVSGSFDCAANHLTNFVGSPDFVGDDYVCTQNQITDLTDLSKYVSEIHGEFHFSEKKIKKGVMSLLQINKLMGISDSTAPFKIVEKYLGKPDQIFDCQSELIEAGYEELAE